MDFYKGGIRFALLLGAAILNGAVSALSPLGDWTGRADVAGVWPCGAADFGGTDVVIGCVFFVF